MITFNVTRTTYKVSDIVSWLKLKTLNLSPTFQRRSVWKKGAKSYLVDTVIRGFPMPIIFLREKGTNLQSMAAEREVVDGQQRLRTLISYIQPKLLVDFSPTRDEFVVSENHNTALAGKSFQQLSDDQKSAILNYEFSVHILPEATDDRQVLQIFSRMNSTGVKLNAQELRNAEYFGAFKTEAYQLAYANLFRWRRWGIFDEDAISRMEEVELISELLMFVIQGVRGKSPTAIDQAYKNYDAKLPQKVKLRKRIEHVLEEIDDAFGGSLAQMPFRKKALFYPFFVTIYNEVVGAKSLESKATLKGLRKSSIVRLKQAAAKLESGRARQDVIDAAERRTTHASSRKTLISFLS